MARQKQGVEPRQNFTVRLSREELRTLEQKAEEQGLRPSQYIRNLIMQGGMVDIFIMEDRRDLINQISRVGNNINQLTRIANSYQSASDNLVNKVGKQMMDIQRLMREVLEQWR